MTSPVKLAHEFFANRLFFFIPYKPINVFIPTPERTKAKQRNKKGLELACLPPVMKCNLRHLKLDRIKDYLLMEEEFVTTQERLKQQEEKTEEDRSKVDDLRGTPMSVGNLEGFIDENHAIVSSSFGPECAVLMHNKEIHKFGVILKRHLSFIFTPRN